MKRWKERCWAIASFCCDGYLRICLAVVVFLIVLYLSLAVGSIIIANTIDIKSPEDAATQIVQAYAQVSLTSGDWHKSELPGTSSMFRGNGLVLTYSEEGSLSFRVRVRKVMGRGWEETSYEDLRKR